MFRVARDYCNSNEKMKVLGLNGKEDLVMQKQKRMLQCLNPTTIIQFDKHSMHIKTQDGVEAK